MHSACLDESRFVPDVESHATLELGDSVTWHTLAFCANSVATGPRYVATGRHDSGSGTLPQYPALSRAPLQIATRQDRGATRQGDNPRLPLIARAYRDVLYLCVQHFYMCASLPQPAVDCGCGQVA